MRILRYLVCAAIVAQATEVEEDDDLSFVRALSGNATSSNTTTDTTTSASQSEETTTSASGNGTATTTQAGEGEGTTQAGGDGDDETDGPRVTNAGGGTVVDVPEDAVVNNSADQAAKNALGNDTEVSFTASEEVVVQTKTTSVNAFHCGLNPDDTACAAANSNTTRILHTRKLSATALARAYDLYCGAFALTSSYSTCSSLSEASRDILFGKPASGKSMDRCVIQIDSSFMTGAGACNDAAPSMGACFLNIASGDNTATAFDWGETTGCVRGVQKSGDTYDYIAKTTLALPQWKLNTNDDLAAISPASIAAAAKTESAKPMYADFLKTAVLVAAVAINDDPVSEAAMTPGGIAGVNLTASLGVTKAQADSLSTAMGSGTLDMDALTDSSSALGTAVTAQVAELPNTFTDAIVLEVTPDLPATASDATALMLGSSAVIGLMSLVF